MKFLIISLILIVVIITAAMSTTSKSNSNAAENYAEELVRSEYTTKFDDVEAKFLKVYKNLKTGANEEFIRETYAEQLYFNDTLRTIYHVDDLIDYMTHTASMIKSTKVKILDTAYSGTDYYIRWEMIMEFKARSKDVYSKSIGMSQLRFNQEGKIVFHHDFWDSTEGLYQHLPYIGYLIRKVRNRL